MNDKKYGIVGAVFVLCAIFTLIGYRAEFKQPVNTSVTLVSPSSPNNSPSLADETATSPANETSTPASASQASAKAAFPTSGNSRVVGGSGASTNSTQYTQTDRYNRPDYLGGVRASATVNVGGKVVQLQPNQLGDFGQIDIAAKANAKVTIAYPTAASATPVIVEAEDGGLLSLVGSKGRPSVVATGYLDSSNQVSINFQSGTQEGIYRITIQAGADRKQVAFWVGPEPTVVPLVTASR